MKQRTQRTPLDLAREELAENRKQAVKMEWNHHLSKQIAEEAEKIRERIRVLEFQARQTNLFGG